MAVQKSGWLSRRTLRTRLVLASIALMAAVSIVIGLVSVGALKLFLDRQLDQQLTSAVRRSRVAVDRPVDGLHLPSRFPPAGPTLPPADSLRPGPGFLLAPGQGQGTLGASISPSGSVQAAVLDSAGSPAGLTSAQRARLTQIPVDERPHTIDFGGQLGSFRLLAQHTPGGQTIITGLPLAGVQSAVYQLAAVITAVGVLGLLAVALIGTAIVRRTMRPLSRVAAIASHVAELPLDRGEVALGVRVPEADIQPSTEVGQVGSALNRLLDHVAAALQARQSSEARVRRFVADASHELRTPLASIRGYAELTRRSRQRLPADVAHALSRVESEAIRMTGLVEDLLMLARLDEGREPRRDSVDLSRLLVDALSDAHAAGPGHRWQLALPPEAVIVVGDQPQLHQIVANLLANARVHTPIGTTVQVRLTSAECQAGDAARKGPDGSSGEDGEANRNGEAVLRVSDDGPGISPDLLPEVFERFARGDSSRSRVAGSTGLGLSIVTAVVAAHGGRVDVTSVPGQTEFTVHLPLTEPPAAAPSPDRATLPSQEEKDAAPEALVIKGG